MVVTLLMLLLLSQDFCASRGILIRLSDYLLHLAFLCNRITSLRRVISAENLALKPFIIKALHFHAVSALAEVLTPKWT